MNKAMVSDWMRAARASDEDVSVKAVVVTDETYAMLFGEVEPDERFVEATLAELGIDNFCIQARPIVRWSDLIRVLKE